MKSKRSNLVTFTRFAARQRESVLVRLADITPLAGHARPTLTLSCVDITRVIQ